MSNGRQLQPHALNPRQEAILEALRKGNTRSAAAASAGVHRDTFYAWLQNPTFSDSVTEAEANAECRNVAVVQGAALGGAAFKRKVTRYPDGKEVYEEWLTAPDWKAAAWWLERRHRKGWRENKPLDLSQLSDEQILRLLEEESAERSDEAETAFADSEYAEAAPRGMDSGGAGEVRG